MQWNNDSIRKYYLETLLLHEIGHSIDSFYKRFWSKATNKERETFANGYASFSGATIRESFGDIEDAKI